MIRKRGIQKGLSGEALRQHVKNTLDTKGHLFNEPTNQAVMKGVIKETFGTEWDKTGLEGILGSIDQRLNNEWKLLRTSAMFMRPTYMIMKAGIEYVPAAQFLVKDFRDGIMGRQGDRERIRAQYRMLMGFGMMLGTMSMWAHGELTGSMDTDFKKVRNLRDAGIDPYTFSLPGGFNMGYRSLDPISTPVKLTANFIEGINKLNQQRKLEPDNDFTGRVLLDIGGAALFSFMQAVKDANLGQGMQQTWTALEELFDPESDASTTVPKFLAEKMKTIWPNSFSRIVRNELWGGNEAVQPANFSQTMMARAWAPTKWIPRQYDLLGNIREMNMGFMSMFVGVDLDQRTSSANKYTPVQKAVIAKLAQIEQQTGSSFTLPFKREPFDVDLRTIYTSEGISFYDAFQREVGKDPNLANNLYRELVQNPGVPVGNAKHDAYAATRAKQLINDARKTAWETVVMREFKAQDARNNVAQMKWLSEQGLLETPPSQFQQLRQ